MKKIMAGFFLFTAAWALYGEGIAEGVELADERAKTSYAIGLVIGSDLKQAGLELNYAAVAEGLRAAVEGGEAFTTDEAIGVVQAALQEAMERQAGESRRQELQFLAENSGREGVFSTESGLQYEVIAEGDGERPSENDTVMVHYEGALTDGTVFDSSYERDEPAEFPLNQVIPGWAEGLLLMNTGSTYRFYIPSELAYGDRGVGQIIPPYSTLVFKVELLEIAGETYNEEEYNEEEYNEEEYNEESDSLE
jgi:FKBP-type peptidyl-prolyl cis-trans isomerase